MFQHQCEPRREFLGCGDQSAAGVLQLRASEPLKGQRWGRRGWHLGEIKGEGSGHAGSRTAPWHELHTPAPHTPLARPRQQCPAGGATAPRHLVPAAGVSGMRPKGLHPGVSCGPCCVLAAALSSPHRGTVCAWTGSSACWLWPLRPSGAASQNPPVSTGAEVCGSETTAPPF